MSTRKLSDSKSYLIRMTRSQQMALTSLVMGYLLLEDEPQLFVDCSKSETVETTSVELLNLVAAAELEP